MHPDYPNLLPELYAVTAILGRGFREPAMIRMGSDCHDLGEASSRAPSPGARPVRRYATKAVIQLRSRISASERESA